jgi:hypothetical protein
VTKVGSGLVLPASESVKKRVYTSLESAVYYLVGDENLSQTEAKIVATLVEQNDKNLSAVWEVY